MWNVSGLLDDVLIDLLEIRCEVRARFEALIFFRNENVVVVRDCLLIEHGQPIHRHGKLFERDVELECQSVEPWNIGHHSEPDGAGHPCAVTFCRTCSIFQSSRAGGPQPK